MVIGDSLTTSPIDVSFRNIEESPFHWHDSLEIVLVLEGSVRLYAATDNVVLKTGDIEIINFNESVQIETIRITYNDLRKVEAKLTKYEFFRSQPIVLAKRKTIESSNLRKQ